MSVHTHCAVVREAASGRPQVITSNTSASTKIKYPSLPVETLMDHPPCVEGCLEESLEAVLPEMGSREQSGLSSY